MQNADLPTRPDGDRSILVNAFPISFAAPANLLVLHLKGNWETVNFQGHSGGGGVQKIAAS